MFYLNFVRLCNGIAKSPSAVAEEMGFQRSVVTRWSKGSVPRKATIEKIAAYFGVPAEELTGEEQKEKPTPGEGSELDARFDALLSQMTDADRADLLEYMEFKVSKRKENPNG